MCCLHDDEVKLREVEQLMQSHKQVAESRLEFRQSSSRGIGLKFGYMWRQGTRTASKGIMTSFINVYFLRVCECFVSIKIYFQKKYNLPTFIEG